MCVQKKKYMQKEHEQYFNILVIYNTHHAKSNTGRDVSEHSQKVHI